MFLLLMWSRKHSINLHLVVYCPLMWVTSKKANNQPLCLLSLVPWRCGHWCKVALNKQVYCPLSLTFFGNWCEVALNKTNQPISIYCPLSLDVVVIDVKKPWMKQTINLCVYCPLSPDVVVIDAKLPWTNKSIVHCPLRFGNWCEVALNKTNQPKFDCLFIYSIVPWCCGNWCERTLDETNNQPKVWASIVHCPLTFW